MRTDFGYFEEKQLGKAYDFKLIRRLYPFARPFNLHLFWSVILVVFITLMDLSIPYLTKIAIDHYIVPRPVARSDDVGKQAGIERRAIRVNLNDPEAQAVVSRHKGLFRLEGTAAEISAKNISQLEKQEIAVLRKQDLQGLGIVTAIFLGVIIFNFALNFAQKLIMEYTGHMIMHRLRVRLYDHIQNLSIRFFTRNPVARLVTRVTNDVQNMHELFTSVISFIFKDLFLLVGITAVLLALSWKLALATFTVLPFVIAATFIFSYKARDVFRVLRVKIAEINTRFAETIGGIKVIQLFRHEARNYLEFKNLNHENYQAGMRQIRILGIFLPAIEMLGVIAVAIVIYYGGSGTLAGSLSLGSLVAFISYMKMFFRPIRDLAEKYNILQNAMASAERIFIILDSDDRLPLPTVVNRKHRLERIEKIQFQNVSFSYLAGEDVLADISFTIKAGETVGVVGPTGSGKTSTINLMTRFYDPTTGRIMINGSDMREFFPPDFRSKMALVTQDPFLFSESIRDNIFRGNGKVSTEEMERILEISNCRSITDKLPHGAETVLSEGGASISSGERQLVSIARAFARNPQLIMFDEATSYIDSQTEIKIQQALEKLMEGRTSVIVAHRLSTVRQADRIIVLNHGRIIETGSHEELIHLHGFYYHLNQLQR
jgi:ATP-binding cassette subfamily B protein